MPNSRQIAQKSAAIKVGLTGGIGCGKSLVATLFQEKGIPIIDADHIAKKIVEPNQPALSKIVKLFGEEVLLADKSLNRKALRHIVFEDKDKLEQLEAILHPKIKQEIQKKMTEHAFGHPYTIIDVPLLIEKNYQSLFDQILVVDCLPEQQITRVKKRDKATAQQTKTIMSSQVSRQQRLEIADEVLDNTGSLDKLRQQVNNYHNKLCSLH